MTMLSPNFSAEELTRTHTGLPNQPSGDHLSHLRDTAKQLEKVRTLLGGPIVITSGYRSPAVNRAVRGVATSAHCLGYAADFVPPPGMSIERAVKRIEESDIDYDQVIIENGRVHLSFDPKARGETLKGNPGKGYKIMRVRKKPIKP